MKFIISMSLIGFFLMSYDRGYNVPTIILFLVAFFGGAPGIGAGMIYYGYRINSLYFVIGIPLLILLHLSTLYRELSKTNKKE